MKRNFTFLTLWALLLALLPNVGWGETLINLSSPESGEGVIVKDNIITITESGDYRITGSTTSYKLVMEQKTSDAVPNIILENASIILNANSMSDKPFSISVNDLSGKVNITLIGKNYLQSLKGKAQPTSGLTVPYGHSIDINGNGILYASGNCGIGHGEYSCGDITISGGTVVAKGTSFSIGGVQKEESLSKFIMGQSAFVVAYDTNQDGRSFFNIECVGWTHEGDVPKVPGSGIYCNVREYGKNATLYGSDNEITLSSPFPDDEFVLDLNGKELTLGNGIGIRVDQIAEGTGTLHAHKVVYQASVIPQGSATYDPLPFSMYYGGGTSYNVASWTPNIKIKNPDQATTYQHIEDYWIDKEQEENVKVENSVIAGKNGGETIYESLWAVESKSINYKQNDGLEDDFKILVPTYNNFSTSNISVIREGDEYSSTLDLEDIGLEIDGNLVKKLSSYSSKPEKGKYKVEIKYNIGDNEYTTTLNVNILESSINLNTDVNVNVLNDAKSVVYGTKTIKNYINVLLAEGKTIDAKLYDVKYSLDGNSWEDNLSNIGTYDIKILPANGVTLLENEKVLNDVVAVNKAGLTVKANDVKWTTGTAAPNFSGKIISGIVNNETPVLAEGGFSIKGSYDKAGTYTITGTKETVKLTEASVNSNYEIVEVQNGVLTVKEKVEATDPIDPTDPKDPNIKPGGDDWKAKADGFTKIYDGEYEYLNTLVATVANDDKKEEVTFTKDKDYTISPTDAFKDVKEGGYEVTVTFKDECKYYSGSLKMKFIIKPRPLKVTVNEFSEEDLNKTSIGTEDVTFENEEENRGLLSEEDLKASAEVEFEKDGDKYKVTFSNAKITDGDNDKGKASNYKATWYYGNKQIGTDGDGNGSIDIDDPTGGDGDGGIIVSYHDLHITESVGAKLVSRSGKDRTPDGGSFTLSLEKEEGYEDCEPTVYYKRGRFGEWKELKLDEVSGYYQIRSVYTDIYVKVSGDGIWPVSNEEVEAQEVKVYTQNGAIVVVTPSVMDVQVVSMTGSVVAADKVAGQCEFRNLVEGVYIVRVGDEIVKVRL